MILTDTSYLFQQANVIKNYKTLGGAWQEISDPRPEVTSNFFAAMLYAENHTWYPILPEYWMGFPAAGTMEDMLHHLIHIKSFNYRLENAGAIVEIVCTNKNIDDLKVKEERLQSLRTCATWLIRYGTPASKVWGQNLEAWAVKRKRTVTIKSTGEKTTGETETLWIPGLSIIVFKMTQAGGATFYSITPWTWGFSTAIEPWLGIGETIFPNDRLTYSFQYL